MADEEKKYTLEELKKELNEKQKIFCHEYIIDWNGARAARAAGYSEKTAKEIASVNLTKVNIQQYIDFIKLDIEKETGITKIRQLNELAKIAYSSISHLHETWIELKEFESLTDTQKEAIESIDTKTEIRLEFNPDSNKKEPITVRYVKIKLHSKTAAIAEINKMQGYNEPEKHNISGEITDTKQINLTIGGKDIDLGKYKEDDNKSTS